MKEVGKMAKRCKNIDRRYKRKIGINELSIYGKTFCFFFNFFLTEKKYYHASNKGMDS